ncbi:MAG: hypothetical protein WC822_07490, partial [Candidatus Paceibacterota bacterium]
MTIPVPPVDPIEDPTAPDMAVVPLTRYARHKANALSVDVPYSGNPGLEPVRKPGPGGPPRQLTAVELRMCEVWVRAIGTRQERAHFVETELKRKYDLTVTAEEALKCALSRAGQKYRKALWMK